MVGGEQANNEEVKEMRKRKKKYAEEKRRKLQGTSKLAKFTFCNYSLLSSQTINPVDARLI